MAELSVRTTIRTVNIEGARQAMVAAARSAGYTLSEETTIRIPGRDWRRAMPDYLYRLSGKGQHDGAFVQLFRPFCVMHPRLQLSHEIELPEAEREEAQKTLERFAHNIEDVVCEATGAMSTRKHEPRIEHEATVEMADGTQLTEMSRLSPERLKPMVLDAVALRMADAGDGTTVVARTISPFGEESRSRYTKSGSVVIAEAEGELTTYRLQVGRAKPTLSDPRPIAAAPTAPAAARQAPGQRTVG